ncbi:flagellar hook-length control protein FliK [Exiguobacterium sp.]|uniref:flagellar hook-length control protein FliK n=1 Tax=Exiguobacterium sp. TaxID=44751 RepID=UPI00263A7298|nr:flagellar hook-length control protein FliK [Exiguobacterium sp.]
MNIALLAQAVQGTTQKGGEAAASPTGQFLQLLSSMLGTFVETPEADVAPAEPKQTIALDQLSNDLEQWLQKPESLEWLKALPQDAYRQFMDAYTGLLSQFGSSVAPDELPSRPEIPLVTNTLPPLPTPALKERDVKAETGKGTLEANVRVIQQIVTQFNGTLGQTPKTIPVPKQVETPWTSVVKETIELLPKGTAWTKPQIDVDTVMYASKSSLPENLKARIEAALHRAPFQSGADGSKVFTVRLYPEQLGELVVKLERTNGELVVKLFASNQDAKQLLQSQLQQLHQTLQPLSPNVRVELNLTQQALDAKASTHSGDQSEAEREQQEPSKGESEDDDHPTEDE